jgi:hypothetical protein
LRAKELLVHELLDAERSSLPTVSRFLDSTERHVFMDPGRVIDEDHAGVDRIRDAPPALEIARVDRAAKTVPGVVRDRESPSMLGCRVLQIAINDLEGARERHASRH